MGPETKHEIQIVYIGDKEAEQKKTLTGVGRDVGYKVLEGGNAVKVYENRAGKAYTLIVPITKLVSLEQFDNLPA